jgi:hypothetical protein
MLKHFEKVLQEEDFETHWVAASQAAPMDQLVVMLPPDKKSRARSLWLTPLPELEEDLEEGISLLQFFATLPFQSRAETQSELERLILQLNNSLPVGSFGLRQPEGVIFYRYVLMLGPDQTVNGKVVTEIALLINFLLDQYSDSIEAVISA